jgi:hypothetical protein
LSQGLTAKTIEKYLDAEDAGRIINPMIADGQVHGGVAQGDDASRRAAYESPLCRRRPPPTTAQHVMTGRPNAWL